MKKQILLWVISSFILLILIAGGCDNKRKLMPKGHDNSELTYPTECKDFGLEIKPLPYDQLWEVNFRPDRLIDTTSPRDSDGVVMYDYNGTPLYHSPLLIKFLGNYINGFYQTGDSAYLDTANLYVNRLMSITDEIGGAYYFRLPFDYEVHQRDIWMLKGPWYSGMTQGLGLRCMVRLFHLTGDSTYLDIAHKAFNSFLRVRVDEPAGKFTVFVDDIGCYWIEEYPLDPPSRTLNGFIFGLMGVYEYYLQTKDPQAEDIVKRCLNTILNYIPVYRRPGKVSFYNLEYRHYAWDYHMLHIRQFNYLNKITGYQDFNDWADSLRADYYYIPPEE